MVNHFRGSTQTWVEIKLDFHKLYLVMTTNFICGHLQFNDWRSLLFVLYDCFPISLSSNYSKIDSIFIIHSICLKKNISNGGRQKNTTNFALLTINTILMTIHTSNKVDTWNTLSFWIQKSNNLHRITTIDGGASRFIHSFKRFYSFGNSLRNLDIPSDLHHTRRKKYCISHATADGSLFPAKLRMVFQKHNDELDLCSSKVLNIE